MPNPFSQAELEEHAACLARLREATAQGSDLATLDRLERAAWAQGAPPADTDRVTQEGAEAFAKRVTVTPGKPAAHWVYGSGMAGCLYDNGPGVAATKEAAIDSVLFPFFDDMTQEQASKARLDLTEQGTHYLPPDMGAQYCEVSSCDCADPSKHDPDYCP